MRILIINNGEMLRKDDGKLYVSLSFKPFLEELSELNKEVLLFQFETVDHNQISSFDYCVNYKKFKIKSVKRNKRKIISYLRAYLIAVSLLPKYDLVYIFYPNYFKYLGVISKLFGKKLGLYIRGEKKLLSPSSRLLYSLSDICLTVSSYFSSIVSRYCKETYTVRPLIDVDESDIVFNRKYYPKDNYSFLYLGRMDLNKGLVELLSACRLLVKNGVTNFHLHVVGGGGCFAEIQNLCSEYKLKNYISFWGSQGGKENIKKYYSSADCYILPTYHEGFPRTLYEAMAYGTPIITTGVGGIPYLIKHKINGILIEPKDVNAVYKSMKFALEHYDAMSTMAKNATRTFSEFLTAHPISHAKMLTQMINGDLLRKNIDKKSL